MFSNFKMLLDQMINDNSLEKNYQEIANQNPELAIQYLIQIIQEEPNSKISQFSTILLGRLISILSADFLSIGPPEFHEFVIQNVLNLLNKSEFYPFSLSLISDLISKLILVYSYSEKYDINAIFCPFILKVISSQNIYNSAAAINALVYCIFSESIDYNLILLPISQFLELVLSSDQNDDNILIPSLRLLYVTYDSISFDFRSFLPNIFNQIKDRNDALSQSIHDIITYLPIEKYSFFENITGFFIIFLSNLLGCENMSLDIKYCSLEIIYNISNEFYKEFINYFDNFIDNLFLFLSNYEIESLESKFIISKIAEKYGGIAEYSIHCYDILMNFIRDDENPNKQIAAMNLFSYSFKGIFIHLSIGLPEIYFATIIQSGIMENPNNLVKIAAFNMLNSLFKVFAVRGTDFDLTTIYPKMIQSIEVPDFPIILISKYKAFWHFLDTLSPNFLKNQCSFLQEKLLILAQNSTPEQLIYILHSMEVIMKNVPKNDFQVLKEFFLSILQNPEAAPFNIYLMVLQLSFYFNDIPCEIFISSFSYIMQLDIGMMTGKDLNSISTSVSRICHFFPLYAINLFHLFIKTAINGLMIDIEYTSIPFQNISSMLNMHVSIEKQNNLIKSYDGSQIQLNIFYFKILRHTLSIKTSIPPDAIQLYEDTIYSLLLKWSTVDFSDQIQYNALKTIHIFLCLTQYKFPYAQLLYNMLNFTISTTKQSMLVKLYHFISQIFFNITSLRILDEEVLKFSFIFYTKELEKMILNRKNLIDQINANDCDTYAEKVSNYEEALGTVMLPFIANPNLQDVDYSSLLILSMNKICLASISFLCHYFIYKERKIEFLIHIIRIFIAQSDEEEKIRSNSKEDPFFYLDSKYAGLSLLSIINAKFLHPNEISILFDAFNLRENIFASNSIFVAIILVIFDKYRSDPINYEILNYLMKVDYIIFFDVTYIKIVLNTWNNIIDLLGQHQFDTDILARLIGILLAFKGKMPVDDFESQMNLLLSNFNGDDKELRAKISSFKLNQNEF